MRHICTILLAFALTLPLHAGVIYQFKTVTEGNTADMVGTAKVDGENFRLELSEGDGVIFQDNSIIISDDGGKTMMVLDPKKKEYYHLSIEDTLSAMTSMLQSMGGMFKMSIDHQTVEVRRIGAGESIEGYPTNKYKVDTAYTLKLKAMGMNMDQQVKSETTTWSTDELDQQLAAFIQYRTFRTGMEDLDALIEKHIDAVKGFPLKTVTKTEVTARGKTNTSTSTMTVTGIKEADVAASEFAVPAGYSEVDGPMAALEQMR
ncbi:MAG: DUF4412 domain-containing protein [Acidobacteria bacterium]|nr:DUF4412 domain-containing protein [Acidobacteriota bacterium]